MATKLKASFANAPIETLVVTLYASPIGLPSFYPRLPGDLSQDSPNKISFFEEYGSDMR
jgi:hypothetical protein